MANLTIQRLSKSIGAIIKGIDLGSRLDKPILSAIEQALLNHHVIFFEKQNITPARLRDVAKEFGPLMPIHPVYPQVPGVPEVIVFDTHGEKLPGNETVWHTDVSYTETPTMGALLMADTIPTYGGDTCWASTVAAYNALSPAFQRFLDGLTAIHEFGRGFSVESCGGDQAKYAAAMAKHPPVVHPVVRVHPVTGLKGLFVTKLMTSRIVELSQKESDAVLQYLCAHSTQPDFSVRWRWSVGDVAFWDNRLTQHRVIEDYLPQRRIMYRATLLGDKPRGPASAQLCKCPTKRTLVRSAFSPC